MDKKKIKSPDTTSIKDERDTKPDPGDSVTHFNEPTVEIDYITDETASKTIGHFTLDNAISRDKTMLMFDTGDIKQKIDADMLDIPEQTAIEDMDAEYLSSLVKAPITQRTEEEQVKINRNFLRDAEPFGVERLMSELKTTPHELLTGFPSLDKSLRIPLHKLTLIAARPGHGKTSFMLNLLLNLSHIYPNKHFLYYSYEEPRRDIEIKLINMLGEVPFPSLDGIADNLERWKLEFKRLTPPQLREKAEKEREFAGLKNFMDVSNRIHIIGANYRLDDLFDSIQAFHRTLTIGAVLIDPLQAIRPAKAETGVPRHLQLEEIAHQLKELGNETDYPVILGAQFDPVDSSVPEYDAMSTARLKDTGDPAQVASLIIGLQNYAKSLYIGSHINDKFKSRFYKEVIKKACPMPAVFKDHPNTVILAKVLANQGRPEPEVELVFNKWLLKISDIQV